MRELKSVINDLDKIVICNGEQIIFSYELVSLLVNDEFYDYSFADRIIIINNIMWLADELDVSLWEKPYEKTLLNAVANYLKHHSVFQLDNLEDDLDVLDYIC